MLFEELPFGDGDCVGLDVGSPMIMVATNGVSISINIGTTGLLVGDIVTMGEVDGVSVDVIRDGRFCESDGANVGLLLSERVDSMLRLNGISVGCNDGCADRKGVGSVDGPSVGDTDIGTMVG